VTHLKKVDHYKERPIKERGEKKGARIKGRE
jgi:hypothetical protein